MTFQNWQERSVSLQTLREEAANLGEWNHGIFGFLQNIGVVPWEVRSMPAQKVRLNIDTEAIPAGYLASAAYEWDSWGLSQPRDFIEAIDAELNPRKREFVSTLLTALGRSVQ